MSKLITFKTAVLAKEKGFTQDGKYLYVETLEHTLEMGRGGDCTFPYQAPRILERNKFDEYDIVHCEAPTQSELQTWLRNVHNIDVLIDSVGGKNGYFFCLQDVLTGDRIRDWDDRYFTFEDCLEIGLEEALKLLP